MSAWVIGRVYRCTVTAIFPALRHAQYKRHAGSRFIEEGLGAVAVIAQHLAVVGGKHDERVVE